MRKLWVRYVVLSILTLGLFAGVVATASRANAAEQSGGFTASAVNVSKWGSVGQYSLPELPSNPPVPCNYKGSHTEMITPGFITVTASPGYTSQKVTVKIRVFQKLEDGSYKYIQGVGPTSVVASQTPHIVYYSASQTVHPGPDVVLGYYIEWYAANNVDVIGGSEIAYSKYYRMNNGTEANPPLTDVCGGFVSPILGVNSTGGTVGSTVNFQIDNYPFAVYVPIIWDGKIISVTKTDMGGFSSGSFKIPAAPMGPHTVEWNYGHWKTKATYTVKPRIKLIPSTVGRGQTVNVSLRGYAKYETVNIRWKKGTSWVKVGQVKTSSTGSANVYLKVPTWAPNGPASVRGDSLNASGGHAQTNAVTVSGGAPLTGSAVKAPTPTPTKTPAVTATSTPLPAATVVPETPEATATIPVETATPEATETPATETATPEPSPTATAEPTETSSPTEETVTPDPTAEPSPTP